MSTGTTTAASPDVSGGGASPGGLQIERVARRFGRRWALAGVTTSLPDRTTTMITGANGSGKTTLLRCLATALKPHQGRILWGGRDLWRDRAALRPDVSFVSHHSRLYEDLSAADNLRVWARLGGLPCDTGALLERVGLPSTREEPVRTFSAGMRRRLSLAVTLLKRPRLALFDEPFAAMDPEGQELVREVVREHHARGAVVVITTHHPALAAACSQHAIHLDAGRVSWSGSAAEAATRGVS